MPYARLKALGTQELPAAARALRSASASWQGAPKKKKLKAYIWYLADGH
jgi:hypothetical protein